MVTVIDYTDHHFNDFRALNIEWLEKYNLMESHDMIILDDPRGKILDRGGFIFLAECDSKIVGSGALAKIAEKEFELVKMAVTPSYQGRGISKILIEKCLETARSCNAKKIILFSNSQLKAARHLYENYGFRYIPNDDSPFVTADIKMELTINR